jgi:multidrug resistance protein
VSEVNIPFSSKDTTNDMEKKDLEISADGPSQECTPTPSIHSQESRSEAEASPPPLQRHVTNSSSIRSSSFYPPIVPRHKRRGLLARFSIVPETTEPYLYPRRTKWMITFTVAVAAAAAPMGSAIIMPSLLTIAHDFNVTPTVTNLSVALYMLSMSIFPLWWSSFSETLGRRTIYITSFILFVIWAILSAVAKNIAMLIAVRMLSGGAAASVQAVGAGTIADIWEVKERGRAMGIFYLGPLCGPLLAPIIGGVLAEKFGWRSTQWFLVIYGVVILVFLIFALPETLKDRKNIVDQAKEDGDVKLEAELAVTGAVDGQRDIEANPEVTELSKSRPTSVLRRTPTHASVVQKSRKYAKVLKRCFVDPLKLILLLRFPAVAITTYYASITFGSLYFLNISIEETFSKSPYNFHTIIIGLLYIPNSLGYFIASVVGGRWLDHIMKREAIRKGRIDANGKLMLKPEDRMRENAWIAGFVFPAALIWYGWTAEKGVIWIVPVSFLTFCRIILSLTISR